QNHRDLPRDNPLVSVEVIRYDIKRSKSKNKGIVPTEMELVLEQTQQGTSHEVSGDPLSPLLFIFVMEALSVAIKDVISMGLFYGARIGSLQISHLLFADGVLILGLLIGMNMSRLKGWDPILTKFKNRLSKWKAPMLSIGGRSTLVSSVLEALGIYYLSLFPMPVNIKNSLEATRAKFFWGYTDDIALLKIDGSMALGHGRGRGSLQEEWSISGTNSFSLKDTHVHMIISFYQMFVLVKDRVDLMGWYSSGGGGLMVQILVLVDVPNWSIILMKSDNMTVFRDEVEGEEDYGA
ncbi:hypothetical protein Tco_0642691, partial [Tanacetum coccineum]